MVEPIFIVTAADIEPRKERYIEYMLSLHKIFYYRLKVYGVISEYSGHENTPPFSKFPFEYLVHIQKGVLDIFDKSPREFISIKSLIHEMESLNINENTFVIKVSGRYLILDDTFVETVKKNKDNLKINSIIKLCDNGTQQHTFLYALRYKYFEEFYKQGIHTVPNGKNIERATLEFLYNKGLFETTMTLDNLGILTNINGEGVFKIF